MDRLAKFGSPRFVRDTVFPIISLAVVFPTVFVQCILQRSNSNTNVKT